MHPPPQRSPLAAQDGVIEVGNLAAAAPDVRILVDPRALEKMPEAFRGTVYESASYAVSHYYNIREKELRAIETMSLVGVLESSLGMAMTVS